LTGTSLKGYSRSVGRGTGPCGRTRVRIAIRFEGADGPVVFACERRDYPASFELPAIIRQHARRLGARPAGDLQPVSFLHREVGRPEELMTVDAGEAKVVCAKLREREDPAAPSSGGLLGIPKVPS
jgi:hypothetical protein